jgi:GT2 family glycosyltransferase
MDSPEGSRGAALAYSVVIATYNRHDILPVCMEHVLRQDRLPREIIIVDATPRWEEMATRIAGMVRSAAPGVSVRYTAARERSSSVQRNQGIALASADVVFLIDDDSLMYPGCAREILAVYEADAAHEIAGVQAAAADAAPSEDARLPQRKEIGGGRRLPPGRVFEWINRHVFMMATDQLFLPYWRDEAKKPQSPCAPGISRVRLFQGYRMTFRREVIARVRFDEDLQRYAAGEDLDASYRASRLGQLLQADRARIHHYTAASGRLSRGEAAELSAMNIAFFLRKHAGAGGRPLLRFYGWIGRRLCAEFLKDLLSRRFGLPQWRAMLHAAATAWRVWTFRSDELRERYAALQQAISSRYAGARSR